MNNQSPIIQVKDLVKTYRQNSTKALSGVSFSVEQGIIYGLLGPNGAGKTTLMSIISTLLKPDSGKVIIREIDALSAPDQIKRDIGLVPQELAFYPDLTAVENFRYFGRMYGISRKLLLSRIDWLSEIMCLSSHSDKIMANLSGGMKRRVNLAIGLIHKPKILLLDEPTVGIDVQSRNMILDLLKNMVKEGLTIVYTGHYMDEAQKLCDKISFIDYGRIILSGAPRDLIKDNDECRNLEDLFIKLTGHEVRSGT